MSPTRIQQQIASYIVDEVLDGEELGLTGKTPLLELGVLNSIELVRLVAFIGESFGVTLDVRSENFVDLDTIVERVLGGLELRRAA